MSESGNKIDFVQMHRLRSFKIIPTPIQTNSSDLMSDTDPQMLYAVSDSYLVLQKEYKIFSTNVEGCRVGNTKKPQKIDVGMAVCRLHK